MRVRDGIIRGSGVGIKGNDSIAWRCVRTKVCVAQANFERAEVNVLQFNGFGFNGNFLLLAIDAERTEFLFKRIQITEDMTNAGCECRFCGIQIVQQN